MSLVTPQPLMQTVQGPVAFDATQPMEEVANTSENQALEEPLVCRLTWTIENFSRLATKKLYSDTFVVGGYKWRVLIFPLGNTLVLKANDVDQLSIYLEVADYSALPYGWSRHAKFSFSVVNQMNNKLTITKDTQCTFSANANDWGYTSFMPVSDLCNPGRGFLMNDTCIIEADIEVRKKEVTGKRKRNNTSSKKQAQSIEYGGNLVGSRIRILDPEDKHYYHAGVKSFNSMQKKHELLYDDGEKELVNLKTEKWELVKNVSYKSDCLKQSLPKKVPSPQSDIICVQGYMVKNKIVPVLEAIFKKYGDIAAECVFKPASMRATFLEGVCEAVRRIETSDFTTIISEMEELDSQVSALEAAKMNVSWLRAHLEAIHKRKKAKENSILLMETKGTTVLVKKAAQMDLKDRCAELVDAQERFVKAERCVRVLDLVEKKLSNNILEVKGEKDLWVKQPIL